MTEPRYRLTESFMAQVYAAKTGKDQAEAAEACAVFLSISQAMIPILARALEATERDAHILDLRGKKTDGKAITWKVISLRVGLSRTAVHDAIKRHTLARRAAWRAAS